MTANKKTDRLETMILPVFGDASMLLVQTETTEILGMQPTIRRR